MEIQWSLVLFTAVSGAGAWLFAFIGLNQFVERVKDAKAITYGCIAAVVLLAVGGLLSLTHLSHVDHVLWVLQHPAPGIFVEALLIGIDIVLAAVFYLLVRREAPLAAKKVVAVLAIVMGFVFTYACGSSYMMSSQLSWNTIALPLGYMGTAIPAGAGAWLLLICLFKQPDEAKAFAGQELACAGVVSLVLGAAFGLASGAATGSAAALFWVGVVIVGSVVPAACGWLVHKHPEKKARELAIAGTVCGLAGSISYRVLMWLVSAAVMSLFGVSF